MSEPKVILCLCSIRDRRGNQTRTEWHAQVVGRPDLWAQSWSPEAALGAVILHAPEMFPWVKTFHDDRDTPGMRARLKGEGDASGDLSPEALIAWLEARGWERKEIKRADIAAYSKQGHGVVVPLDREFTDFKQGMARAAEGAAMVEGEWPKGEGRGAENAVEV